MGICHGHLGLPEGTLFSCSPSSCFCDLSTHSKTLLHNYSCLGIVDFTSLSKRLPCTFMHIATFVLGIWCISISTDKTYHGFLETTPTPQKGRWYLGRVLYCNKASELSGGKGFHPHHFFQPQPSSRKFPDDIIMEVATVKQSKDNGRVWRPKHPKGIRVRWEDFGLNPLF